MIRILIFLFLGLGLSACQPQPDNTNKPSTTTDVSAPLRASVVYGEDDRLDIYQVENENLLRVASSTVALMPKDSVQDLGNGTVKIKSVNFGQRYQLCESEPFREQETAAFCSGFLVGPNKIVTAGHCMTNANCPNTKFVFNFAVRNRGELPRTLSTDDVYSCKNVIKTQNLRADYGPDFAVIELDRDVVGHEPLAVRSEGQINVGEPLVVIGHPSGLPTKVAGGANVRDNSPAAYFVANLDTYGGNSGSAVFNGDTGVIEGILVRGEVDYVTKSGQNCRVSNVCADDKCMGEHVTKIEFAKPYF